MDSSKIFGAAEECHSSESGWTMYIGSPIDGDDDGDHSGDDHDDEDGDNKYCNKYYASRGRGNDSDDSMASDASSGPSRRENSWVNESFHKKIEDKVAEEKQAKNQVEKKRKGGKGESVFAAKGANVAVQSGEKVKKNTWFGKRK